MHSLALAPTYHDLLLRSCKNKRRVVGRIAFEARFEQNLMFELHLHELCIELEGRHSEAKIACQVKAHVIILYIYTNLFFALEYGSLKNNNKRNSRRILS